MKGTLLTTTMTWNNNVRRQVLTLYRAKLRITREMGYQPGTCDRKHMTEINKWGKKHMYRLARRKNCGDILWTNIKYDTNTLTVKLKKVVPYLNKMYSWITDLKC